MRCVQSIGTGRSVNPLPGLVPFEAASEELPQVTAQAGTIDEARKALHELAAVIFDAERQSMRELLAGKEVVRETFVIPLPRGAPCDRSLSEHWARALRTPHELLP